MNRFQKQTQHGKAGNCLSACLASLMGIPLDTIPNFSDGISPDDPQSHIDQQFSLNYYTWLRNLGWWVIYWDVSKDELIKMALPSFGLFIGTFKRINSGILHACIIDGKGEIVFDPAVIPADNGPMELVGLEILYPLFDKPTTLLYDHKLTSGFGQASDLTPV